MKNIKKNCILGLSIACLTLFHPLQSSKKRIKSIQEITISPKGAHITRQTTTNTTQAYILQQNTTTENAIVSIGFLALLSGAFIISLDCMQEKIMQYPCWHWLLIENNYVRAKINMVYDYLHKNNHVKEALKQYIQKVKTHCLADKKLQEHALLLGVPYRYIKRLNELKKVYKNSTIFDVITCEKCSDEQIKIFTEDGYILCALVLLCNDYKNSSMNTMIYDNVELKPLKELSEALRPILARVGDISNIDIIRKGFVSWLATGICSFGESYAKVTQYHKDKEIVGENIASRLEALEEQKQAEEQHKQKEAMWDFIIQPMIKNIRAIIEE